MVQVLNFVSLLFKPNFYGLEEKWLLAPETLTNSNINESTIVLI